MEEDSQIQVHVVSTPFCSYITTLRHGLVLPVIVKNEEVADTHSDLRDYRSRACMHTVTCLTRNMLTVKSTQLKFVFTIFTNPARK